MFIWTLFGKLSPYILHLKTLFQKELYAFRGAPKLHLKSGFKCRICFDHKNNAFKRSFFPKEIFLLCVERHGSFNCGITCHVNNSPDWEFTSFRSSKCCLYIVKPQPYTLWIRMRKNACENRSALLYVQCTKICGIPQTATAVGMVAWLECTVLW